MSARPLFSTLSGFARAGLDLVFPRDCIVTGEPVEDDSPCRYLSAHGLQRFFFVQDPCCPVCGFPFFGELVATRVCPHCRELEPVFGHGRPLILARDGGRDLVHALKYHDGRYLLPDVATMAGWSSRFCDHLAGAVLVPVPLFPKRQRKRGYNQSLLLAKAFARAVGQGSATGQQRVAYLPDLPGSEDRSLMGIGSGRSSTEGRSELAESGGVSGASDHAEPDHGPNSQAEDAVASRLRSARLDDPAKDAPFAEDAYNALLRASRAATMVGEAVPADTADVDQEPFCDGLEALHGCEVQELLVRTRDTPSQTHLNRKQREDNMRGAFALKPGVKLDPNRRYVVVDDVFTTGATLNACARVLQQAGAQQLDVAMLAHG